MQSVYFRSPLSFPLVPDIFFLFLFMSVFSPLFSVSGNFPGEVKRKNGDGAFSRQEGKGEKFYL